MTESQILNLIGLSCDLLGVCGLFKYGMPQDPELNKEGIVGIMMDNEDENIKKKWKKFNMRSKISLVLIIIGFVFQGLSTMWTAIREFIFCM